MDTKLISSQGLYFSLTKGIKCEREGRMSLVIEVAWFFLVLYVHAIYSDNGGKYMVEPFRRSNFFQ